MNPEIIFLGTGGTTSVGSRQLLRTGGFIIRFGDNQFSIDPGPGALSFMQQMSINPRQTMAVLVTHAHINHCSDVNALLEAMTYSGLDCRGLLVCNPTLVKGDESYAPYVAAYYQSLVERVIVMDDSKRIGVNQVIIESIPAKHSDPAAVGYRLTYDDFSIAYTGDTELIPESLAWYKSNVLILNVPAPFGEREPYHLNADDAVKILREVQPKMAVITHFGMKAIKFDTIHLARMICNQSGVACIAAKDGLVLSPGSYPVQ